MGIPEILIIIVVVALLFGAKRIPEIMKGMGQGVREFKKEVKDPVAVTPVITPVDVASRQLDPVTGLPMITETPVIVEAVSPAERR